MIKKVCESIPNKRKDVQRAWALTLVVFVTLWAFFLDDEPMAISNHHDTTYRRILTLSPNVRKHDEDDLCIMHVDDGNIRTSSVIDEHGESSLALPEGYEATVTVECTRYTRKDKTTEESVVKETYVDSGVVSQGGDFEPSSGNCSDRMSFQPGYYDLRSNSWYDHCAGQSNISPKSSELTKELCPIVDQTRDIWVSFIGDSVTKQFFQLIMKKQHNNMRMRNFNQPDRDHMLGTLTEDPHSPIWMSYDINFVANDGKPEWDISYTWGDFLQKSAIEKKFKGGPRFDKERVPDIVFYSPGYHATEVISSQYGSINDEVLSQWQAAMRGLNKNASMPKMYLMLNMMPAPWMIPEKYSRDRSYRTLLNEYRKNKAIIASAKKFEFVKGVVDTFSIELPFNGKPGSTAHHDAVHLNRRSTPLLIARDRIIDTICHSEEQDLQWSFS